MHVAQLSAECFVNAKLSRGPATVPILAVQYAYVKPLFISEGCHEDGKNEKEASSLSCVNGTVNCIGFLSLKLIIIPVAKMQI